MVKKKDVGHGAQPPSLSLCLQSDQRLAGDKALSDHAQRSRPLISNGSSGVDTAQQNSASPKLSAGSGCFKE